MRLDNVALELDFHECVPGYESELAIQLGSLQLERDKPLAVFKCLGRYDVLSVRETSSLNLTRTPPLTEGIKSEAALLAFGWESIEYTTPSFNQYRDEAAALLSLLKISPAVSMFSESFSFTPEPMQWVGRVAAVINELCPSSAIYSTMGSYQLLLFQFGGDIQVMLDNVNVIRGLSLSYMESAPEDIATAPLIDDSVTLPLVAYDENARLRTKDLSGRIKPLVFMGCPPGIEPRLRKYWTDQGAEVSEVYGKPDLLASWADVSVQKFVSALIERRLEAKNYKDLGFTSSVLLKTEDAYGSDLSILPTFTGQSTSDACEFITNAIQHLAKPDEIGIQSEALRDNLRLLLSRLQSALKGPRSVDFLDMERFAVVLARMVLAQSSNVKTLNRLEGDETLAVMLGYGLRGMSDRASSGALEVGGTYDMPTRQTDVARIVDAAAYVPEFILNCCTEKLPEHLSDLRGNWTGFVLFDRTPGPAHGRREIIILPVDWLCRPIRHWWTIGHEVWHALYFRRFEEMFIDTFEELYARHGLDNNENEVRTLASELFANWMDFYYCFNGDLELFQSLVWEHWLTLATVHDNPTYYLLRSFLIYISTEDRIAILRKELDLSPRNAELLMQNYWEQFSEWTSQHIPKLNDVIMRLGDNGKKNVLNSALLWHPLLDFFATEFGITELRSRIRHSNYNIDTQVHRLLQGEIPKEPIDNPVMLLVTLAKISRQTSTPSPGATAAVIHVLANGRLSLTNEIEGRALEGQQEMKSCQ